MQKIQLVGGGFLPEYSSCSDIKPKYFDWTREDHPIKVFVDSAIAPGTGYQKRSGERKIAWVCESRAIFHSWFLPVEIWEQNIINIANTYDLVFVSDRQWVGMTPNIKYCPAGSNLPWIKDQQIFEKTKLVSMVASGKKVTFGHNLRHDVAEQFKDKIDLFGGAAGSTRIGEGGTPWPNKAETLNPYMFSITIENDKYETYFTEKLTDCFATGTIPVYWGAPDIGKYFNPDGIIELTPDFDPSMLTKELYQSKLEAVRENFNRVKELVSSDDQLFKLINEN
jgi:hypothetical protein